MNFVIFGKRAHYIHYGINMVLYGTKRVQRRTHLSSFQSFINMFATSYQFIIFPLKFFSKMMRHLNAKCYVKLSFSKYMKLKFFYYYYYYNSFDNPCIPIKIFQGLHFFSCPKSIYVQDH